MIAASPTRQRPERTSSASGRSVPRRRFWFDPRFAIGLVLIVVSVAATVLVVSTADARQTVLQARHALVPGDVITADDVVEARVAFSGSPQTYLAPSGLPRSGLVVTRTVAEGELVPTAALGEASSVDSRSVVVSASGALASAIVPGATIDLWSAAPLEGGGFAPPTVLVSGATVSRIDDPQGIVVSSASTSVELLVPKDAVAAVLGAVSNKATLSIVPTARPVGD